MSEHTPIIISEAAKMAGYQSKQIHPDVSSFIIQDPAGGNSFVASDWNMYPNQQSWHDSIMRYKNLSTHYLSHGNFMTIPGFFYYTDHFSPEQLLEKIHTDVSERFDYPIVLKPNNGSRSKHVYFAKSHEELSRKIVHIQPKIPEMLVQSFVDQDEYRIFIYKGEIQFMYQKRYQDSMQRDAAPLPETLITDGFPVSLIAFAKQIYNYTTAPVIGVDLFIDDLSSDNPNLTILELNHNPGLSVLYKTYNKKELAIQLLSSVYKEYLD